MSAQTRGWSTVSWHIFFSRKVAVLKQDVEWRIQHSRVVPETI